MHKALFMLLSATALSVFLAVGALAQAPDLTGEAMVTAPGGDVWMITDHNRTTRRTFSDGGRIALSCDKKAYGLYLIWDAPAPTSWTLTADGQALLQPAKGYRFLHEYVPLPDGARALSLSWEGPATLCDLVLLGEGELPDFVQNWRLPEGKADLLLLPTHADDEHLYYGGIMPRYADDGHIEIQVAYMVNHNGEAYRPHELLNGLWEVGIRRYPVIPDFPDVYADSLEQAKTIYDEAKIVSYQSNLLRQFMPQVVVGHDRNGEYGHGAHQLNTYALLQAVEQAAHEKIWDTPKLYLHLAMENPIVLDYNVPLPAFAGKTAFEMAVAGFAKHTSQQKFFKVEQEGPYDCRKFGLVRSTVGLDQMKNDLFEHLTPYSEQVPVTEPKSQQASETEIVPSTESEPVSSTAESMVQPTQGPEDEFAMVIAFAIGLGLMYFLPPALRHRKRPGR